MLTCTFENGGSGLLRHVVVDAICINKKNEILLVKRAPHLVNGSKYALPGGYLDRNETAAEAVVREVMEETGIDVYVDQLFCINDNPNRPQEDRQNVAFIYTTNPVGGTLKTSDEESTEIRWFALNSLPADKDLAFDHRKIIELYCNYLNNPGAFKIPLIGVF